MLEYIYELRGDYTFVNNRLEITNNISEPVIVQRCIHQIVELKHASLSLDSEWRLICFLGKSILI